MSKQLVADAGRYVVYQSSGNGHNISRFDPAVLPTTSFFSSATIPPVQSSSVTQTTTAPGDWHSVSAESHSPSDSKSPANWWTVLPETKSAVIGAPPTPVAVLKHTNYIYLYMKLCLIAYQIIQIENLK